MLIPRAVWVATSGPAQLCTVSCIQQLQEPTTNSSVGPTLDFGGVRALQSLLPPFMKSLIKTCPGLSQTLEYADAMQAFFETSLGCPIALNVAMILSSKTKS